MGRGQSANRPIGQVGGLWSPTIAM